MNAAVSAASLWMNAALGFLFPEVCQICNSERASAREGVRPVGAPKAVMEMVNGPGVAVVSPPRPCWPSPGGHDPVVMTRWPRAVDRDKISFSEQFTGAGSTPWI